MAIASAIVGGIIAGAGAIGAAKIGSNATKSAAASSAAATDQAAQVQKDIYAQNAATLSPYAQAGIPATAQINALLGLSPSQPARSYQQQSYQAQPTPQANAMMPANDGYQPHPGYIYGGRGGMTEDISYLSPNASGDMGGGWGLPGTVTGYGSGTFNPDGTQVTTGTNGAPSAQSAFDTYRNSTGYQFRLGQGFNALNSGWAGNGMLKSGAAAKGAINYGQGMASQEFGNDLGALGNQQAMGLSAASATAGVGQNYANSLGNLYTANGANQANAALVNGQNNAQLVNSLATIGAGLFGSKK